MCIVIVMSTNFWQGKRVFITGHTGFRGSHLALALQKAGAIVFGYSLAPATTPNFFEVANVGEGMTSTFADVRDAQSLNSALEFAQAEVVFHLAGGGGLKESLDKIPEVYSTQVMGTVNLLESLKQTASVRAVVVLTSDKVYRVDTSKDSYSEEDALAGNAPVSAAKACTELVVESYLQNVFSTDKYNRHKISIATARMGAVVGGGDFDESSLVYLLAQAAQGGGDLPLRNPNSQRAWLYIDDAVNGLLSLAEKLIEKGPKAAGPWNFGVGSNGILSVSEFKNVFMESFNGTKMLKASENSKGISVHGILNSQKAEAELNWSARCSPTQAAQNCAAWYKKYYSN